jgi:hypothetical protein
MQKQNFNKVAAIFGMRGTGKTEFLRGNEALKLPGIIKAFLTKGMKVLIVDTILHPSYKDVPQIQPEQLPKWKKGVYRVIVRPTQIPAFLAYLNTLHSVWNSLIVFEDAYKHQYNKLDQELKELIIDSKQKNIDIIFMYHSFAMAPKDLYRMLDLIELFKTKDHPQCRKDDMPGYYSQAIATYTAVQKNASRFFHKTIDTEL